MSEHIAPSDYIERNKAIAAIEALKYGDIAHDNETLAHNRALSEAAAALNALPAVGVDRNAIIEECAQIVEHRFALIPTLTLEAATAVAIALPDAIRALAKP